MEVPENMTAQADDAQQIPGSEVFPAGLPDAPHGDMPLEYNVQNFNALSAANTAMQTEISGLLDRIRLIEEVRDVMKDTLKDLRSDAETHVTQIKDLQQVDRDNRKKMTEMQTDIDFAREEKSYAEKRLERAFGYLDAMLDRDDDLHAPTTKTVPAPRPTRGPDVSDIERPVRRDASGHASFSAYPGTMRVSDDIGVSSPRRYR